MIYKGDCHCGRIAFEAEDNLEEVTECNCSICSRRSALRRFVPRYIFRLLTAEVGLAAYTFNEHKSKHRFCRRCRCAPFGEYLAATGQYMVVINARGLDDVDISPLNLGQPDGRRLKKRSTQLIVSTVRRKTGQRRRIPTLIAEGAHKWNRQIRSDQ